MAEPWSWYTSFMGRVVHAGVASLARCLSRADGGNPSRVPRPGAWPAHVAVLSALVFPHPVSRTPPALTISTGVTPDAAPRYYTGFLSENARLGFSDRFVYFFEQTNERHIAQKNSELFRSFWLPVAKIFLLVLLKNNVSEILYDFKYLCYKTCHFQDTTLLMDY